MDKPIYALSGYAEWFWLMAKSWKDVENRDWPIKRFAPPDWKDSDGQVILPQRIYLHASRTPTPAEENDYIFSMLNGEQFGEFINAGWESMRGRIIGEITITGQSTSPMCSKWFFGKYGFTVKDGVLYDKPIPCRGRLGFFKPELGDVR